MNLSLLVTAPLQEHVISIPPLATRLIAMVFNFSYFLKAGLRNLALGQSFGGSRTTTS
eukprot:CAMPEP_0197478224 /NCGR_PEP_ID=MMETSP1309-20131121/24359_1 /TAXON_ID=464262 /ORGANISM="Genus nov. species nov., Strain RCC998" /LENGTH=57 /DNA_ID=CAMNT_0043019541 /DNA_START=44 /DNA_END=214 /DNA_ORIENTATION=+